MNEGNGRGVITDKMPKIFEKWKGGWVDMCSISALVQGVAVWSKILKRTFSAK